MIRNLSNCFVRTCVLIAAVCSAITCSQREEVPTIAVEASDASPVLRRETGTPNPPETLTVRSEILGQDRRIYVQLPEGYDHTTTRYPVLVVLDGEWIFDLVRANVRFLSEIDVFDVQIPRMIVVGIENIDRDRDYVPTVDPDDPPNFDTAGEADAFLAFLGDELFPVLDREYRTAPGRTVVGWSFGGLAAMYSAVARPELFRAYLCIGPAIWWDDDLVVEMIREARFDPPKRMVVTLGSLEKGGRVHDSTTRFLTIFEESPVPGLEVTHIEFDGVGHSWGIPRAAYEGLRKLFRGYVAPDEVSGSSLEGVEEYYRDLSQRWGFDIAPPIPVMQSLAMKTHSGGNEEQAIAILEKLVSYEPDAAMAFYFLGEFYAELDRPERALQCYREALAGELRRDVPRGIYLQPYQRAVERAESELATATNSSIKETDTK